MPVDTLVADPVFQSLPVGKKREVLSRFDPSFSRLTDEQVSEFALKAQKPFDANAAQDKLNAGNTPSGSLKGPKKITEVPRPLDERAADLYPIIGGIGGEYAGGPIGAGVGGAVGETIKQIPNIMKALKGQSPEQAYPLKPNPNAVEQPPSMLPNTGIDTDALKNSVGSIVGEGLTQGGFSKAAGWLGDLGSEISAGFKNSGTPGRFVEHLPIEGNVDDAKALIQSDMPRSVGQQSGNKTLNWIESATAPKGAKVALKNSQSAWVEDQLAKFKTRFGVTLGPGSKPYSDLAEMGQDAILSRRAGAQKAVSRAYDNFDAVSSGPKDTITIPQIVEPEKKVPSGVLGPDGKMGETVVPAVTKDIVIKQPIYVGKATNALANNILPELDSVVDTLAKTPADPAYGELNKLRITLHNIQDGPVIDGIPVIPWKTIKQLRTDINDSIRYSDRLTRAEGGLKALRDSLGTDVETSVGRFSDPRALDLLKRADSMHQATREIFNDKVMKSVIKGQYGKVDPSQMFNDALANPDRAREIIRALGPDDARLAKGHFFSALDASAGSDPNSILNKLNNPAYREVFSAHDYQDLTDFFRAQRRVQEFSSDAGNQAGLLWKKAGVALSLGGAAGSYATGGDSKPSNFALAGGMLMLGGRTFASRILLNPKYARAAGRLTRVAPSSTEAAFLRRTILTGLRGAQGEIKYENGKTMRVQINANGEPEPLEDK